MNSKKIRNQWLDFFKSKNHTIIPTKSLIPFNDNSLLWINSGVATLKDFFSGKKNPPSKRLTNSQKAIRTNDIENVGITARHHTFFEMLGNFSIGDYFKKEAIEYACEYILDVLKLEKEKLYFTYYHEDLETKKLWIEQGFSEDKLIPGTKETNFWEVGSGPCGPNTEIFYDRGEKYDNRGIELLKNDIENDRYIEIWNIVFSTYNSDGEGNYTELKQKNIDTGAGLERIASILQNSPTNYDTDLFLPIIKKIEDFTTFKYDVNNYFTDEKEQKAINTNFKIIADHMRTVTNAIADGAIPSNIGRGYIIRRLLRRSVYKAMQLQIKEPVFLYKLVKTIKKTLPFEYDEKIVEKIISDEERLFNKTIDNGRSLLEKNYPKDTNIFSGEVAFKLFETYGFPIELTTEILKEKNISVDFKELEIAKNRHIEISKNEKTLGMDKAINSLTLITKKVDKFVGYNKTKTKSKILYLLNTEEEIDQSNDEIAFLVLDKTPFYATSGGQRHDKGMIKQGNNEFEIIDVFKDKYGNHVHKIKGSINRKDTVECFVDKEIRLGLERNHSGTHLLYCALRNVLGDHIVQLGSDNNEERLTFDLPADVKPSEEEIKQIEDLIISYIDLDSKREYLQMSIEQAKKINAILTLEESEYMDPKSVRIVKFDKITADLCGGTHLSSTKKLEKFKIVSVQKKAAGVFRIKALTSKKIVDEYLKEEIEIQKEEFNKLIEKNKELDPSYSLDFEKSSNLETHLNNIKKVKLIARNDIRKNVKSKSNLSEFSYDTVKYEKISDIDLAFIEYNSPQVIKNIASTLREKNKNALVVVCSLDGNKTTISFASKKVDSDKIAKMVFKIFNGKGGGNKINSTGTIFTSNINMVKDFIVKQLSKWEN